MKDRLPKLIAAVIAALAPSSALGQDKLPPARLRIATWDFSDAVAAGALKREEPKKAVWRTTFGAERYTPAKPAFDPTKTDSDVLLLQGVTTVREARQFFPAKEWRLVFSRKLLAREDGAEATPVMAIAVRYQKGVRVAGQEHFEQSGENTSGLAVRIMSQGRTVWVASTALDEPCRAALPNCAASGRLHKWRQDKISAGANAVVLGGSIAPLVRPAPQVKPVVATAPVAEPAPPPTAKPAVSQPPKSEPAPSSSVLGWLLGWNAPAEKPAPPPPPKIATPPPAPPAKAIQPAKAAEPAPPPPTIAPGLPEAVTRRLEKDGAALRLAHSAPGASCSRVSLLAEFDASGFAQPPEHGTYMEKLGCLAFMDLAIDPAPPPPPTLWPETVEPAGSGADPDIPADDAG